MSNAEGIFHQLIYHLIYLLVWCVGRFIEFAFSSDGFLIFSKGASQFFSSDTLEIIFPLL